MSRAPKHLGSESEWQLWKEEERAMNEREEVKERAGESRQISRSEIAIYHMEQETDPNELIFDRYRGRLGE